MQASPRKLRATAALLLLHLSPIASFHSDQVGNRTASVSGSRGAYTAGARQDPSPNGRSGDGLERKLNFVTCQPGQFINRDLAEESCNNCTAGKWSSGSDAEECLSCRKGRYAWSNAAPEGAVADTFCKACEVGFLQLEDMATSYKCTATCAPGKHWVSSSQPCELCPAGYKGRGGSEPCKKCPTGKSTGTSEGHSECYEFCRTSLTSMNQEQSPCVPPKQNCTENNECDYGKEYWNNSMEASRPRCEPCSKVPGVNCFIQSDCESSISMSPSLRQLAPLPGYYRVPWIQHSRTDNGETWKYREPRPIEFPLFLRCPYAGACTSLGCTNTTTGPLCAQCEEGHFRSTRTDAGCTPCELGGLGVGARVGILIAVIFLLLLLLGLTRRRLRQLPKSSINAFRLQWRAIVGIISIWISYFQVGSSLSDVVDVPWDIHYLTFLDIWSFVNLDLVSLLGLQCLGHSVWNLRAKIILSVCFLVLMSLLMYSILMYQNSQLWKKVRSGDANIALLRDAAAHHLLETVDIDQDGYINAKEFKFLLRLIQYKDKMDESHSKPKQRKGGTHRGGNHASGVPKHAHMLHGVDSLTSGEISILMAHMGAVQTELGKHKPELLISKETLITKLEDPLTMREFGGDDWVVHGEVHRLRVANISVLLTITFSLFHAPFSRQFLSFVQCQDIGGKWYIRSDLYILCQGDSWGMFAFFSVFLVIVYTFALPAVITYQLCRHRKELHSPAVQRQYGFLYKRFNVGSEFWEVIECVRKLVLMGVVSFFGDSVHRIFACTLVSVIALALLLIKLPHRTKGVLQMEMVHFSLIVYKYIVIFYAFADDEVSPAVVTGLVLTGDIIFLLCVAKFIMSILYITSQNISRSKSRRKVKSSKKVAPGGKEGALGEQKTEIITAGKVQHPVNAESARETIVKREMLGDSVEVAPKPTAVALNRRPSHEGGGSTLPSKRDDNVALVRNWGASSDDEADSRSESIEVSTETKSGEGNVEAEVASSNIADSSSDDDSKVDKSDVHEENVAAPARSDTVMARALADFVGQHESNIPLTKGQLVKVLGKDEHGWTPVETNGISGQVPTSYLDFAIPQ